jgi:hypothetical protein
MVVYRILLSGRGSEYLPTVYTRRDSAVTFSRMNGGEYVTYRVTTASPETMGMFHCVIDGARYRVSRSRPWRIFLCLTIMWTIGRMVPQWVREWMAKPPDPDAEMAMLGVIPIVLAGFAVILAVLAHVFG